MPGNIRGLVIGVGNPMRGDDGVGPAVVDALPSLPGVEVVVEKGDGARMMERWQGHDRVWIVDACRSGAEPGKLTRFDATSAPLPSGLFQSSSHLFGLTEAIETARALKRLPRCLTIYAIEGREFGLGASFSEPVELAIASTVDALKREVDVDVSLD